MNNTLKTIFLFAVLSVLLIGVGRLVGGTNGMVIMAIIGIAMNIGVFFFSDKIAIASASAKPLDPAKFSAVVDTVRELTSRANMPMPRLYLSPGQQPNAFATGRSPKHSAVVVTQGILQVLDRNELRGVLAHELSHIKNRDVLISTIAAVFASMITAVADFMRWSVIFGHSDDEDRNPIGELLIFLLAPIAALILQLAISRAREYEADRTGAQLAGDPNGLADALEKLEAASKMTPPMRINPAFANLYITNPLGKTLGVLQGLFSTHPPIAERVSKLRNWRWN